MGVSLFRAGRRSVKRWHERHDLGLIGEVGTLLSPVSAMRVINAKIGKADHEGLGLGAGVRGCYHSSKRNCHAICDPAPISRSLAMPTVVELYKEHEQLKREGKIDEAIAKLEE